MGKCRIVDKHHIKPSSRFKKGDDTNTDNIVFIDRKWHRKWHALFGNMTVEEVVRLLKEMFVDGEVWDNKRIRKRIQEIKGGV